MMKYAVSKFSIKIKQLVGNIAARLFRAAIGRIIVDLELMGAARAAFSSSDLVNESMSDARSCISRMNVLEVAFEAAKMDGFVCELGVYRGESLNKIAQHYNGEVVYGFDTFSGLPESWRDGFSEGVFDVSDEVLSFEKNCQLYKGLFSETLPVFLDDVEGGAKLIHVDCDLYSSSVCALRLLAPRIRPGTVIVFDEYFNYPGWKEHEYKAFVEFMKNSDLSYKYIAYNKFGQQVAVIIVNR